MVHRGLVGWTCLGWVVLVGCGPNLREEEERYVREEKERCKSRIEQMFPGARASVTMTVARLRGGSGRPARGDELSGPVVSVLVSVRGDEADLARVQRARGDMARTISSVTGTEPSNISIRFVRASRERIGE